MVDYYKILGIRETASAVEVKSAYRKLARERHPDVNSGSHRASRDFALIAIAYRTLGDSKRRAHYDAQRDRSKAGSFPVGGRNPYLQRMRTVAAQARMDRAINALFESDRLENRAFQQSVYPVVALFISSFLVTLLRPRFWSQLGTTGHVFLIGLFVISLWHIGRRLGSSLSRYSRARNNDSIAPDSKSELRRFSPAMIIAMLGGGVALCAGAGLVLGEQMQFIILQASPFFFDTRVHLELFLYPPIGVLIVDMLHSLALKADF